MAVTIPVTLRGLLLDRFTVGCLTVLAIVSIAALVFLNVTGEDEAASTYVSYIVRGIAALVPILVTLRIGQRLNDAAQVTADVATKTAADTQAAAHRASAAAIDASNSGFHLLDGALDSKLQAAVRAALAQPVVGLKPDGTPDDGVIHLGAHQIGLSTRPHDQPL